MPLPLDPLADQELAEFEDALTAYTADSPKRLIDATLNYADRLIDELLQLRHDKDRMDRIQHAAFMGRVAITFEEHRGYKLEVTDSTTASTTFFHNQADVRRAVDEHLPKKQ